MSFPVNFTKLSKGRHFTVTEPNIMKLLPDIPFDTSFQNDVLVSLQLFLLVCYQVVLSYIQWNKIASSTVRNFHNSWSLHFEFLEIKIVCRNIWLIENWKRQLFYVWNKTRQNRQNFQFFKGLFSVMSGPRVWLLARFQRLMSGF